jgi:hypothetical protein
LNKKTPREFRWTFKQMPGETHTSIPHQSIYSGLDTIFDGWHLANPLKLYDEGGLRLYIGILLKAARDIVMIERRPRLPYP